MRVEFTVDKAFMEVCATSSLSGALIDKVGVDNWPKLKKVHLVFPQTTMGWKRENGGPDVWILMEHSVALLVSNILQLQRMGIQITMDMPEIVKSVSP